MKTFNLKNWTFHCWLVSIILVTLSADCKIKLVDQFLQRNYLQDYKNLIHLNSKLTHFDGVNFSLLSDNGEVIASDSPVSVNPREIITIESHHLGENFMVQIHKRLHFINFTRTWGNSFTSNLIELNLREFDLGEAEISDCFIPKANTILFKQDRKSKHYLLISEEYL